MTFPQLAVVLINLQYEEIWPNGRDVTVTSNGSGLRIRWCHQSGSLGRVGCGDWQLNERQPPVLWWADNAAKIPRPYATGIGKTHINECPFMYGAL